MIITQLKPAPDNDWHPGNNWLKFSFTKVKLVLILLWFPFDGFQDKLIVIVSDGQWVAVSCLVATCHCRLSSKSFFDRSLSSCGLWSTISLLLSLLLLLCGCHCILHLKVIKICLRYFFFRLFSNGTQLPYYF